MTVSFPPTFPSPPPPRSTLEPEDLLFATLQSVDLLEFKLFATSPLCSDSAWRTLGDRKWLGDSVVLSSESLSCQLLLSADSRGYLFIHSRQYLANICQVPGPAQEAMQWRCAWLWSTWMTGTEWLCAERAHPSPSSPYLPCSISCTHFWASPEMALS